LIAKMAIWGFVLAASGQFAKLQFQLVTRLVDYNPLPDPAKLTVGDCAQLVRDIKKLARAAAAARAQAAQDGLSPWDHVERRIRRELVLASAPEFSEFQTYLDAELGMPVSPEALLEVERRLARCQKKSFEKVRLLTLGEALAVLQEPLKETVTTTSSAVRPLDPPPPPEALTVGQPPSRCPVGPLDQAAEQEQGLLSRQEAPSATNPAADQSPTRPPADSGTEAPPAAPAVVPIHENERQPEAPADRPAPAEAHARQPEGAPRTSDRLLVSRKPPRATLDGNDFNLGDEQAAFLDLLHQNLNHWVEPAMFEADSILTGLRRDRIKRSLPSPCKRSSQASPAVATR
jgi:hypothetical protein